MNLISKSRHNEVNWIIENYHPDNFADQRCSQLFNVNNLDWYLSLTNSPTEYRLTLRLLTHKPISVVATSSYSLIVKSPDGSQKWSKPYLLNYSCYNESTNKMTTIPLRKPVNPEGHAQPLIICCRIQITQVELMFSGPTVLHDFSSLLVSKKHSDMTLNCAGKSIRAHKVILAARSPVLENLISAQSGRSEETSVTIHGVDPETMESLLQYLYFDVPGNIEYLTMSLLKAAEMFQLENLKELCEIEFMNQLKPENALDIFLVSDLHGLMNLKRQCIMFINLNRDLIIYTRKWSEFSRAQPFLAAQLGINDETHVLDLSMFKMPKVPERKSTQTQKPSPSASHSRESPPPSASQTDVQNGYIMELMKLLDEYSD